MSWDDDDDDELTVVHITKLLLDDFLCHALDDVSAWRLSNIFFVDFLIPKLSVVDKHRLCASAADLWQHIWKQLHAIKCLLTLLRQDNCVSLLYSLKASQTPQSSPFRLPLIVIHLHSCSFSTSWLQFKRKCCSWTAICYSLLTHHIYFLWFFNLERFWKWMFLTSSPAHAHGENEPYILSYNISCSHIVHCKINT